LTWLGSFDAAPIDIAEAFPVDARWLD